jgi:hypothetical protein
MPPYSVLFECCTRKYGNCVCSRYQTWRLLTVHVRVPMLLKRPSSAKTEDLKHDDVSSVERSVFKSLVVAISLRLRHIYTLVNTHTNKDKHARIPICKVGNTIVFMSLIEGHYRQIILPTIKQIQYLRARSCWHVGEQCLGNGLASR